MNPKTDITENEWRNLMEEIKSKPPPNSKTAKDLCSLWRCTESTVYRRLRPAMEAGRTTRQRFGGIYYYTLVSPPARDARGR